MILAARRLVASEWVRVVVCLFLSVCRLRGGSLLKGQVIMAGISSVDLALGELFIV